MVEQGCIPPLCDLFVSVDHNIIKMALEGVENLLRAGRLLEARQNLTRNPCAAAVEACSGLVKLKHLQDHESNEVYGRSNKILREYFNEEGVYGVHVCCLFVVRLYVSRPTALSV